MNEVNHNRWTHPRSVAKTILDFLIGFLGSLLAGNIGIVLLAQVGSPADSWSLIFPWFWRFALAGLAVYLFTRKRIWISTGILIALLTQAFGIFVGIAGLAVLLFGIQTMISRQ